ncbi:Cupin 2 conserved barrel [Penicillium canariense]|uniref:Cupin 2 conserved barrel n=1 Tax=Penicillium canariense TaxID=189055 RepID=A0A9W9LIM0_9EURO|nr:Cupin 2 conserved barrel [Penicillium canariense]KAJ5157423.1 Cupin 2 conserved barrel [Penicillium canariense]
MNEKPQRQPPPARQSSQQPSQPLKTESKPTILPPTYTQTTSPESFPNPAHGNLTWHTLISRPQTCSSDLSAGIAVCPPRTGRLCPHRHAQAEIYYILAGEGEVSIDGVVGRVQAGSTVFIPSDAQHGIVNVGEGELRWFYVFPTGSFGDVIYRFAEDRAKL